MALRRGLVLGAALAGNQAITYGVQFARGVPTRPPLAAVAGSLAAMLGLGIVGGVLYSAILDWLARRGAPSRGRAGALAGVLLGLALVPAYVVRPRQADDMTPLGFLLLAVVLGGGIGAFCATLLPERPATRRPPAAG